MKGMVFMSLNDVINYAQEVAEKTDNFEDKICLYQVALWLQELEDFRDTYEADKDWLAIDESTRELIEHDVRKQEFL
jgi:hypothetical protein